ncbi:MAG TPA: HEAT repeat domain-containing protein [Polyangia bacterium]
MSSANKRWLLIAGAAAAVAAIVTVVARRAPPGGPSPGAVAGDDRRSARTDFPGNNGGGGAGNNAADGNAGNGARANADTPSPAKQVENVMAQWRSGILVKDADAVVAADGIFRQEPKKFREALMTLAETDGDERVRAFSTRVLGKFMDPTCAPLFIRLLDDKSQFVRMNAAWGLGELATTPEGRAAAKPALHSLRRLAKRETIKDTREAASLAAGRLM